MSVTLDPKLVAIGGARTGIAPANLIDVQDVNGNQFYWADRAMYAAPAIPVPASGSWQLQAVTTNAAGEVLYRPWLLGVPQFSLHRSLATDMGSFVLQNLSGTTLARDLETQIRASALQGAFFIYRCWQADAEAAWLEVHGTLTLDPGAGTSTAQIKCKQLLDMAQADTPNEIYCETCQLDWGGARCGSTQSTECLYSFQSCQVVERIRVIMNNFEKNYGDTTTNVPTTLINRSRRI